MHAHHVFPVALAENFDRIGIDIWNVSNAAWWEGTSHLQHANEYNELWRQWFRNNPNGTAADAMAYGQSLAQHFGFDWP